MDGCGDSLDLVPIAAWNGKGKRTGKYGAYLLACYDEDDDQYQVSCLPHFHSPLCSLAPCVVPGCPATQFGQILCLAGFSMQTVCKIGTGFSDEDLATLHTQLKNTVIDSPKNYYCVADSFKPDVWFEPTVVWEVKCADLSISPVHKAGVGLVEEQPNKGIALRFPRFMRVRDDKTPEGATTAEQVVDMFRSQSLR